MAVENIVKTKFTVSDKITKRFGIMAKAAARFGFSTEKSFKRASRSASRFSSVTKGIVAGLGITKGLSLVTSGISEITTGFIAFEKAARGATVRFKDIGPTAENFAEKMREVRASARAAGAATEFTAAQAASALDFLARAGFSSAEAMGALGSMIDLATASGEDFASAADKSSDLLGAFGLNADDTAQKIKNLNRVNDVLVKTANSANVTLEDMFETMKVAGPIGRGLGIELEEVAALTAIMGNSGIKGSVAATALKNSFLNLSTGGKKVTAALDKIGVRVDDGSGNMRKFTDVLQEVGEKIKDLGTLDQAAILDAIFGKRAIAGASNLIENIRQVKEFEKSLLSAGETSKRTADIMRESLDAKIKTLISTVTELGFKILEAFEVRGKKGIESLTEAIRNFDVKPVISFFETVASGIAFIWEWRGAIMALTGVFFVFKILTGLLTAISVIAAANPLTLIILGVVGAVAAITAGVVALFTFIDDLIAGFNKLPLAIKIILLPLRVLLGVIKKLKSFGSFILEAVGFGGEEEKPPIPTPESNRNMAETTRRAAAAPEEARRAAAAPEEARRAAVPEGLPGGRVRVNAPEAQGTPGRDGERGRPAAPNAELARARATEQFRGRLDIGNAPPGSKLSITEKGAGSFDVALLGA